MPSNHWDGVDATSSFNAGIETTGLTGGLNREEPRVRLEVVRWAAGVGDSYEEEARVVEASSQENGAER